MHCHPTIDLRYSFFFFFNDTATTEIYTLSLHDALPIFALRAGRAAQSRAARRHARAHGGHRSEEHTSELQSRQYLVCRLLLEKKKKATTVETAPRMKRLAAITTER